MKKMISLITCMLVLVLSLTACGRFAPAPEKGTALAGGGILVLSVNPEIAVEYDESGNVTGITARNDDAIAIIANCEGLIGQPTRDVVSELVTRIGNAGYFVEEIDGGRRQITLEIEPGSVLPNGTFLEDVIADIQNSVNAHDWTTPLVVEGITDYDVTDYGITPTEVPASVPSAGMTDYDDTDYGPNNDGITDYDNGKTDYNDTDYGTVPTVDPTPAPTVGMTDYDDTDYGPNNDGVTDYDDTDYGPSNDGITDYDDTDYGPSNDGITDYDDTDYGPSNDGVTDYDDTDYGPNSDGVTDYDDTDYGPNNDGVTDYDDTDYGPNNDGVTDYDDGKTDYDPETEGVTDYDDGKTDYNEGDSDYDGETVYGNP